MGGLFFSAPLEHARRYASPGALQQWHRMEFVSDLNSVGGTLAPLRALTGRCEFWKREGFYEGKRRLRRERDERRRIYRHRKGILDHPITGARKPFSDFEARIWLLLEARWAIGRILLVNGRRANIVNLDRDQVSHSLRYVATAWGWSVNRALRFLRRLEMDAQITAQRTQRRQS